MGRKQRVRATGDLREHPRYSIEEAAHYLCIPVSTLKAWTKGYKRRDKSGLLRTHPPVLTPADPERGLLSFLNLNEAYVLRFARQHKVPLLRVRNAMEYIRSRTKHPYPLLRRDLATRGKSVFIRELGLLVDASQHGQLGMNEVLRKHLRGIKRDADGLPTELRPILNKSIAINPDFSSGEPIIAGTGIMVSILVSRKQAGDDPDQIARDYGIDRATIEQAIRAYKSVYKAPKAA